MEKIAAFLSIIMMMTAVPASALAGSIPDNTFPYIDLGSFQQDKEITDCLISAYGVESSRSTVYTFAVSDHLPDDSLQMKLLVNDTPAEGQGSRDGYVTPLRYISFMKDRGAVTRYLFLIDCSTSMPAYKKDIQEFVRSLIERNDKKDSDAVYTIAGCGTKMEVFGQADMTDLNKVMDVLDTMDYGQQGTDFYTGVTSALKYLKSQPLSLGSLTNLILITDGVPFMEDGVDAHKLAESAKNKIEDTPEILVHTLCLDHWEGEAEKYVATGAGRQDVLSLKRSDELQPSGDELKAVQRSGRRTAEYVNNLYVCAFDADNLRAGGRLDLQIEYKYKVPLVGSRQQKVERTGKTNSIKNIRILAGSIIENPAEENPSEEGTTGKNSTSDDTGTDSTASGAEGSTAEKVAEGSNGRVRKGEIPKESQFILSRIQKDISDEWPEETALSKMKARKTDVTRKTLILLFLATYSGEDSFYSGDMPDEDEDYSEESFRDISRFSEEELTREEIFLDTKDRIDYMLSLCGFAALDPRSPFDWLILYCMCTEDLLDMDERMRNMFMEMFGQGAE